jgi:hypothetical protein
MAEDSIEIKIPGEFNAAEEALLEYLYVHPAKTTGTRSLTRNLRADRSTTEQKQYTYEEILSAIETLIADRLAAGKRVSTSGRLSYEKIRLTTKGEAAAIKERKREKKIAIEIRDLGSDK